MLTRAQPNVYLMSDLSEFYDKICTAIAAVADAAPFLADESPLATRLNVDERREMRRAVGSSVYDLMNVRIALEALEPRLRKNTSESPIDPP